MERQNVASVFINFGTSSSIGNWVDVFKFKKWVAKDETLMVTNASPLTFWWSREIIRSVGTVNGTNIMAYGIAIV